MRERDFTIAVFDPAPKNKLALGRRELDLTIAAVSDVDPHPHPPPSTPLPKKKLASGEKRT